MESSSSENTKEISLKAKYLGLQITNDKNSINEMVISSLTKITDVFSDTNEAKQLIEKLKLHNNDEKTENLEKWRLPSSDGKLHITTYFKKTKVFSVSHPTVLSFEEGKTIEAQVLALIYIPEKIITSVVFVDTPVDNKFPHMTTLLCNYKAKCSNDVISELYASNKEFQEAYQKLAKEGSIGQENKVLRTTLKLYKQQESIFVVFFAQPFKLETVMKQFYG